MTSVFDMLFGCWHKNYSFPITHRNGHRRPDAASLTGTYVVCLDCGKEFGYDWQEMKVVADSPKISAGLAKTAASYAGK